MAKPNAAEDDSAQEQTEQLRVQIGNAMAFVEGQKATQSFAALTPEDCYDRFIERIEGADTVARPNVLHRLDRIKSDILVAVEKIKALPDSAFRDPDEEADVNTPP